MATHNLLGKAGEDAAVAYLTEKGYSIRHRNWRNKHWELDIVAAKDDELVVVEVKTRSNTQFARPEEAVNMQKIKRIVSAADAYIKEYGIDMPVRFDIIAITGNKNKFHIAHIPEAFHSPIF